MVSKGKRQYLVALYQPDGFFYRGEKLCYKFGNQIMVDLVCTGPVDVGIAPQAYDIEFDVLKKHNTLGTFTADKASQWGNLSESLSSMTQCSRHHMAVSHPENFQSSGKEYPQG